MAKNTDHLARSFETENTGGVLTGFLAEEDEIDRGSLWRLGSWGAASVGAVIVALYASQSSIGSRRDQVAAADLLRQSQQIQSVARESQNETRRLASAIDTPNSEPDPVTPPKPEVVAYAPSGDNPEPDASQAAAPQLAVQRTEFGVDVGGANSLNGLRALWRGLLKSKSTASLATLRPIIVVKESN